MRQNPKNNRSRGRGRKGPNPLTRSYESNGPDVKVRGTAQHVAEKYMTLARDALSFSDGVAAENYFQHAEHYNRIIMTAQAQQNVAREEDRRNQPVSSEQTSQPAVDNEQPAIVTGDEPQPVIKNNRNDPKEAQPVAEVAASVAEEQPKPPRKRRAPRPRPVKQDAPAEPQGEKKAEATASETIADNPPAFLMSD